MIVSLAVFAGCDDKGLVRVCGDDAQCPPKFACNEEGRCVCTGSEACADNEICNAVGQCQLRVGCETSLECPSGQFCDRISGNCLDRDRCTADVQCALGHVCDNARFECVAGCRDVGDCELGGVCECENRQSSCQLKQCRVGPCGDDSFCKYGERCVAEFEGDDKRCVRDERGPFCEACRIGPGQDYCRSGSDDAGDANFCLVDTSTRQNVNFCGVDCNSGQSCPWGFECHDVLILTQQTCGGARQCRLSEFDCLQDGDCKGGTCDGGKCRASCVIGEGDVEGFCTCLSDNDCPSDICDSGTRRCAISQVACDPADDDPCPSIYCKNEKNARTGVEIGYCFIGRNCAPSEGITCGLVRGD